MRVDNRRFVAKRTRAERARDRRGVTLEDLSITPKTKALYFFFTCKILKIVGSARDESDLDDLLAAWIEKRWAAGAPLFDVNAALCGLHHFLPWTKRKIPRAWKLFKTWRRREAPRRVPPMPAQLLFSLVHFAVEAADLYFAALLLLGFEGLLRTGELLQIRACDYLVQNDQILIHLANTKTSLRRGADEVVVFHNTWSALILAEVKDLAIAQGRFSLPLWNRSPQSFRKCFRSYLKRWQVHNMGFKPYSLRRGGATHLFMQCKSYDLTTQRGRWNSVKASRVYIQEGLSQLPHLLFPNRTQELIAKFYPFSSQTSSWGPSSGTVERYAWMSLAWMQKVFLVFPAGGIMSRSGCLGRAAPCLGEKRQMSSENGWIRVNEMFWFRGGWRSASDTLGLQPKKSSAES